MGQETLRLRGRGVAEGVDLATALKDGGRAHPGADAHGHHAEAGGLSALAHLVQQRRGRARACSAPTSQLSTP